MRLCRIFAIITCLLTLTACGSKGANEIVTEDSSEEASQTVVKNEENDTMPDYSSYENIIEGIRKGMEDPLTFRTQNEVLGGYSFIFFRNLVVIGVM